MHPPPPASDLRFSVRYRITIRGRQSIAELARDISIEQTVECPIDSIPQRILHNGITGRVEAITPVIGTSNGFDVTISYRCDITDYSVPQLLNVMYGNISLKNSIKVLSFDFPEPFLNLFRGPSHGIDGIRKLTGVYGRPLACAPLKPMGLSVAELAALAGALAAGGVDLIKDDHGISNQPFHPFYERVSRCQEAIQKENARTGMTTIYCPMVSGRFDEIEAQVQHCVREGVRGVLIAPMLVGCDTVRYLSGAYDVVKVGHPSLTGAFFHYPLRGMAPSALLGTIFRLIGVDICDFPNTGGRFFFTREECRDLSLALQAPLGSLKRSFPCPAGGMSLEKIGELARDYGKEAVLLFGGSLLRHSSDRAESAKVFMDRIRSAFPG